MTPPTPPGAHHQDLLRRREAAVPRGAFNIAPLFAERTLGASIWDIDGKRYIDFCGGIGVLYVGHNHPRVVDAVPTDVRQAPDRLETAVKLVSNSAAGGVA